MSHTAPTPAAHVADAHPPRPPSSVAAERAEAGAARTVWHACYNDSWRGLIVPEAFAHPAKFAPGLIRRIYTHGLSRGWWRKGDLIADPFGGIAGGGIMAGYAGLNWIGVELEEKFVALGNANLARHGPNWMALGETSCVKLVQGDSRRFAEVIGKETVGIVTSPPYAESIGNENGIDYSKAKGIRDGLKPSPARDAVGGSYGASPGQIGALKSGDVAAVVTSPPYNANEKSDRTGERRDTHRQGRGCFKTSECYGNTAGQIGALRAGAVDGVVTSPPFLDRSTEPRVLGSGKPTRADGDSAGRNKGDYHYSQSDGQIGRLPGGSVDGVVTSPPWEKGLSLDRPNAEQRRQVARDRGISNAEHISPIEMEKLGARHEGDYGGAAGQIGNDSGETYWQAMHTVYGQCLAALRPGGYMTVVVKDYVQNKRRVPLCDQTMTLLLHLGFEPVERIHAMLVRETEHECMFSGTVKTTQSRKSFFRRLAEKKGSPRIDYEEVLVVRAPGGSR